MCDISAKDDKTRARTGVLTTEHGLVHTPAYVVVGTHGAVRCLEAEDIPKTKTQLIIANTYHLWRSLGDEGLHDYPGIHEVIGWQGPLMTDSGGFQVFSLGFLREKGMRRGKGSSNDDDNGNDAGAKNLVRITEAGAYFRPEDLPEGEEVYLDAEASIKIQEQLGADIIVAFDEPTSPLHDHSYTEAAMERTHKWAERSLAAKESSQKIYGVVQGGAYEDLRSASAKFIGALPFDGFAVGGTYGDAYGGTKEKTRQMLKWSTPHLPENKPRHLFGVGRIEDILDGVEAGVDTFDCVIPTREARHGGIWTAEGRLNIKRGVFSGDDDALDALCACPACLDGLARRELYELFKTKNPQAGRLATIHNVYFFNEFMDKLRQAIKDGGFGEFKAEYSRRFSPVDNSK